MNKKWECLEADEEKVRKVVEACKQNKIPIRIGVNAGSLEKDLLEKYGKPCSDAMIESAKRHVEILEKLDFYDIAISLKASNLDMCIEAYEKASKVFKYPLHLGVTEAGTAFSGTIKSNIKFSTELIRMQIDSVNYQKLLLNSFVNESVEKLLIKSIDENGYVLDEASPTLKSIRKRLTQLEINLKQKLQEIIAKESSKLSQTSVVLRDDRYCIAVKSEFKNQIKGIIHDTSASQQTCFIEPFVVSQIMSDKAKLIEEEKAEVHQILKNLSHILSEEYDRLKEILNAIVCFISSRK